MARPDTIAIAPALVVEDDPAMQRRLRRVLASAGVADGGIVVAGDIATAQRLSADDGFALTLVDVGLPDGSGVDFVAWRQARQPDAASLVVSALGHEDIVFAALRAGACGYLLKERDDAELAAALHSVAQGGAPIDPMIAARILAHLPAVAGAPLPATEPPEAMLSDREREILGLVAQGFTNREIADLVSVSRLTVDCHTKNIYRKLAVGSRTAAVFEARALGLLH